MPTTVYELASGKSTGDKHFATEVNATNTAVELIGVRLAQLFGEGCFTPTDFNGTIIPGSLAVQVSAGTAIVGATGARKVVNLAGATNVTGLKQSTTNYVYLQRAGTFTSNTTGTPPANSHMVLSCVTNGTEVTSVNNDPSLRINLPAPWCDVTVAASVLTIPAVDTTYYVECDFSAVGTFGSVCYIPVVTTDQGSTHIQIDTARMTTGKFGFLVYVETGAPSGSYGTSLQVQVTTYLRGTGWTGSTRKSIAAAYSEPAAI